MLSIDASVNASCGHPLIAPSFRLFLIRYYMYREAIEESNEPIPTTCLNNVCDKCMHWECTVTICSLHEQTHTKEAPGFMDV